MSAHGQLMALSAIVLAAGAAHGETVAPPAILVENAKIVTGTGKRFEPGAILLRGDRVSWVGPSAEAQPPPGTTRIDAKGGWVTAGLIDAFSRAGLMEVSMESSTVEVGLDDRYGAVRAAFSVEDGYNPASPVLPVTRIAGITTAALAPGGGLVSGRGAIVDLAGATVEDALVRRATGVYVALGGDGRGAAFGARGGVALRLRELLDDVRQYAERREDFEENRMRRVAASRLDLEALIPAVVAGAPGGPLPFIVEANRATDILAALRFAREEKVRLILTGCDEGWRVADRIAAAKVPVIVSAIQDLPASFDSIGARLDGAALLHKAGVKLAISALAGEPHNARTLRFEAGNAVAHGLPWDAALDAVTRAPAEIFGLADRGTLEPGRIANVVVWSGDPFETRTRVRALFIRGRSIPLVSRQTLLRDRYRDLTGARPMP